MDCLGSREDTILKLLKATRMMKKRGFLGEASVRPIYKSALVSVPVLNRMSHEEWDLLQERIL